MEDILTIHYNVRAPGGNRRRGPAASRFAVLSVAAVLLGGLIPAGAANAETLPVGSGSYTTDTIGPAPEGCAPLATDARAFVTDTAPAGAVPTNDWWSSLLFKKYNCVGSEPLHAHPLSYLPEAAGLGLSNTTTPTMSGTPGGIGEFHYAYAQDLMVGVAGLTAPVVEVADWTDWTVTPSWSDGTRSMTATIGHGLPFSWYDIAGGDAVITAGADLRIWLNDGERIGFSSGGGDYVAFAPTGAAWTVSGTKLSSTLNGKGYLSVAALPTSTTDTDAGRTAVADQYTPYAYAKVTGTRADFVYNVAESVVETTYSAETEVREGTNSGTVLSLYPHQSAYLGGATGDGPSAGAKLDRTYVSPRGAMTTLVGATSFTTHTPFTGVLPEVPAVATGAGEANARLDVLLDQVAADPMSIDKDDTYWTGKALGRAARIVEIADQLDRTAVRDTALAQMKETLTNWFTASPGETEQVFAYNSNWGTLVGFPASYGSDKELNDHHFHYGYFVVAAATLARFDPEWAADAAFGGMVDELIADANNFDRADTRYPYLRDFDIYAGHDWASGHGAFGAGNNQESSSEGQNFANGLIQWGTATGDTATRDAGIYLYATQTAAIQQYWFDESGAMPDSFGHSTAGMIWGDGGTYSTWFSAEAEMIQGINTLPITGGHLYLGLRPDDVVSNYAEMVDVNNGNPTVWQDILWSYLALGDGQAALSALDNDREYPEEEGESRAHTYHWIANLASLGTLDSSVHADDPMAAVFTKNGARTYVASNITQEPLAVTFSDGTVLEVAAGKTATSGAHTWSGGGAPSGTEEPTDPTDPPAPTTTTFYLGADGSFLSEPGTAPVATLAPRSGQDAIGDPATGLTLTAENLNGTFAGSRTAFDIGVDTAGVGNGTRIRVSYDLTGDGTFDRIETYNYFPTDPVAGYERYTSQLGFSSVEGELGNLVDGSMKVELWNVLGTSPSTIDLATSVVKAPFAGLTLTGGGSDPDPEPSGLPGSPSEVKLTPVSGSAIDVLWAAPTVTGSSPVTDYRLQYRATGASEWVPVYDAVTSTPGARIQGLSAGTEYQVRVQAVSAAGLGEFSQPVAASTFPAPSAPRGAVTKVQGKSLLVSWTAPISDAGFPITDYVIETSTDGVNWKTFGDGVSTATSAKITGLLGKTQYQVRIAAVSEVGTGAWLSTTASTK
ncbi:fibronectin type III domain-containing protein [Pseudarthrobacter oxydans]|nr:fibronectin type III domain-containing protein [Pseudarthrobacter oxydans]